MAKITVVGEAVVVTSSLKFEDIKMVQKYRPEALTLKDEEGNPIFRVAVVDKIFGNINKFGAEFTGATRDEEKLATITLVGVPDPDEEQDVKELIADKLGSAIINLAKIEESIPEQIKEIQAERDSIVECIKVQ